MLRISSLTLLGALTGSLALGACGSDDPGTSAFGKCNALTRQYCATKTDCAISGGMVEEDGRADAQADCESKAEESLDCSSAVGVSDFYDSCIHDLKNLDCDELNQSLMDGTFMLPGPCTGVILLE